ncbi:MAG TPA: aspartate aminotransferase family protein [Candidatus Binatia bacterium]|nr:aspartate aminotransferase family protein [Candidatus Binatia bacterium]
MIVSTYQEIAGREQKYLLNTYARYPLAIARGKGVYVYDVEGRRYLDFLTGLGVNALGHSHPRIVKVIRDQAAKIIHVSNLYYNEYQGLLAEKLCTASGMDRAFFSNSGTEAIEGALKLVRAAGHAAGGPEKCVIIALDNSFHGRTMGALALTGQPKYRKDFDPMLEGVRFVPRNDVEALRGVMDGKVCAIVLEPIQGEGGIQETTPEFLTACRELADQHQAALIFDEIQCGMGRTGRLFAFEHFGVTPDVVCIAKPIAAGLPLGAFLSKEQFARHITPGKHGTTFGGGPLTCRVALEYLAILEDENLLERVRRVGAYLSQKLRELVDKFDIATEVRGVGAIQALQLTVAGKPVLEGALADGLLINVTQENVLRFLPPFLLEEKDVDRGIRILRRQLAAAQKQARAEKKAAVSSAG